MTIQSNLNETERVNFLKENREEIISFISNLVGENELNTVMGSLLDCMNNVMFYDLCDMEERSFNVIERIEIIVDELSLPINVNVECQNYFEEQREIVMNKFNNK